MGYILSVYSILTITVTGHKLGVGGGGGVIFQHTVTNLVVHLCELIRLLTKDTHLLRPHLYDFKDGLK